MLGRSQETSEEEATVETRTYVWPGDEVSQPISTVRWPSATPATVKIAAVIGWVQSAGSFVLIALVTVRMAAAPSLPLMLIGAAAFLNAVGLTTASVMIWRGSRLWRNLLVGYLVLGMAYALTGLPFTVLAIAIAVSQVVLLTAGSETRAFFTRNRTGRA
jgi:hypothetical protein